MNVWLHQRTPPTLTQIDMIACQLTLYKCLRWTILENPTGCQGRHLPWCLYKCFGCDFMWARKFCNFCRLIQYSFCSNETANLLVLPATEVECRVLKSVSTRNINPKAMDTAAISEPEVSWRKRPYERVAESEQEVQIK